MAQAQPWLIVGLGNPGAKYDSTRHNVGRDVVMELARRSGVKLKTDRSGTMCARARIGSGGPGGLGEPALLAVSRSFMNISGPPYASLAASEQIPPERVLVIHDDLDLDEHLLKLKFGGGEGGHNGLKSLSGALKTRDYRRLRMGIGRPPGSQDPASYVLAPIGKKQREGWDVTVQLAADAVEDVLDRGFEAAQMKLHTV